MTRIYDNSSQMKVFTMSMVLIDIVCCVASLYSIKKYGIYTSGSIINLFYLFIFSIHLIYTVSTNIDYKFDSCSKRKNNLGLLIWYFVYCIYSAFLSFFFHCDVSLASFLMFMLLQIFVGAVFICENKESLNSNKKGFSDSLLVLFFVSIFTNIFYFGFMYLSSEPYKQFVIKINELDNTTLNTDIRIPLACMNPRLSIEPDLLYSNYTLQKTNFTYYFTTPIYFNPYNNTNGTFDFYDTYVTFHNLKLVCGESILESRYSLGIIMRYALEVNNVTESHIYHVNNGIREGAFIIIPVFMMAILWFLYFITTMDFDKNIQYQYLRNTMHDLGETAFELQAAPLNSIDISEIVQPESKG